MSRTDHALQWRPMTRDEVLAYIDYVWRIIFAGEPQPDDDGFQLIDESSNADELIEALEFEYDSNIPTETDFVALLNRVFGTEHDTVAWRRFLDPNRSRSIADLVEFIMHQAKVPVIEPIHIAGMTSWEAGLFRVVTAMLSAAGIEVRSIRPSTELSEHILQHPDVFRWTIARLAPTHMPSIHIRQRRWVERATETLVVIWMVTFVIGVCVFTYLGLIGHSIGLGVVCWIVALIASGALGSPLMRMRPTRGAAGEMRTFHDLCSALAVRYRDSASDAIDMASPGDHPAN